MAKKIITPKQALERLETACVRSELCTGEVREKLFKWGIGREHRDSIIDTLVENRFIDDARYARAYVRDRINFAHWGRRKISASLAAKHVARNIIANALDGIDETEYFDMLCRLIRTRLKTTGAIESREEYLKTVRFGVQRGFETELVIKAVRIAMTIDDEVEE